MYPRLAKSKFMGDNTKIQDTFWTAPLINNTITLTKNSSKYQSQPHSGLNLQLNPEWVTGLKSTSNGKRSGEAIYESIYVWFLWCFRPVEIGRPHAFSKKIFEHYILEFGRSQLSASACSRTGTEICWAGCRKSLVRCYRVFGEKYGTFTARRATYSLSEICLASAMMDCTTFLLLITEMSREIYGQEKGWTRNRRQDSKKTPLSWANS